VSQWGLTFEELLASILLEERFMDDWARQIVDHQLQDRLNLFLAVASIMCEGGILGLLV